VLEGVGVVLVRLPGHLEHQTPTVGGRDGGGGSCQM
jgi:hypothetical protein